MPLAPGTLPRPFRTYLASPEHFAADGVVVEGPYRVLELEGRRGLQPLSIHSRICFPEHHLQDRRGSLTLWAFALEEIATFLKRPEMFTDQNRGPQLIPLLSDHPDAGNFSAAAFFLGFEAAWHPAFLAKFYCGDVFLDAIRPPQKAYAMASALDLERHRWHRFTLTWDFDEEEISVYLDGVRVAHSDRFHTGFHRDPPGPHLFAARPTVCLGELALYREVLSPRQVEILANDSTPPPEASFRQRLLRSHAGIGAPSFDETLDRDYETKLFLPLDRADDLDHFRLQGMVETLAVSPAGLHVRTLPEPYEPDRRGRQAYLWLRPWFEGDLSLTVEFRPNQAFGLALLVFQASGMSREDIEVDYPLRTTGNMHWIHSSDMRSYHLEFFRRMTAVRNDLDNAALIKNPFQLPLGFGCLRERLQEHRWHTLRVVQQAGRIHVGINGTLLIDAVDHPFTNNGAVLDAGRVALRCMIGTDLHFRNLRVAVRPPPYRVPLPSEAPSV